MSNNLEQEITPNFTHNVFVCSKCNKEYKARNSLWYHEKKCNKSVSLPKDDDDDDDIEVKEKEKDEPTPQSQEEDFICKDGKVTITKEMFLTLIKNSEEMMYKNFNSLPPLFKNGHL